MATKTKEWTVGDVVKLPRKVAETCEGLIVGVEKGNQPSGCFPYVKTYKGTTYHIAEWDTFKGTTTGEEWFCVYDYELIKWNL